MTPVKKLHAIPHASPFPADQSQGSLHAWWERFKPRKETRVMPQEAKGVFIPYPLLAIVVPLLVLLIGGVIGLCTIVYSQNNALIKAETKNEQQDVYIHDDREKLIRLQDRYDELIRTAQEKRK
jgi:hypothetical protein